MTRLTTAREPTLVRFATPYLQVETQSILPLERVIERELAQASLAANKHRRTGSTNGTSASRAAQVRKQERR
jgi:hypothetical protein